MGLSLPGAPRWGHVPLILRVLTLGLPFPFSLSLHPPPLQGPDHFFLPFLLMAWSSAHTETHLRIHTNTHPWDRHRNTCTDSTQCPHPAPGTRRTNRVCCRRIPSPCTLRDTIADTDTNTATRAQMARRRRHRCVFTLSQRPHVCVRARVRRPAQPSPAMSSNAPCSSPASAAAAPLGPLGVARL